MAIVIGSKSKKRDQKLDKDQGVIEKSMKRWKITEAAESESRKAGLEDLKFSIGTGQWDAAVKANREIEGKPCLTLNRIPTFLRQYTGEERQHRPSMIVSPVGDGADQDVAKIHQGMLRHTEVVSFADVTYDNAYDWMLRTGWSNWRINQQYVDDRSFNQEPRIEWIENAFAVYLSPIRKPDGTDPLWAHVIEDMGKEEYKAKYPKSQGAKLRFSSQLGNPEPGWVTKDGVRIAEYWWLELEEGNLCQLADGSTIFEDEMSPLQLKRKKELVVGERDSIKRKVCWVKHNAVEVLEKRDYLGKFIPIVEVSGVRLNVDGKIYKAGMVRDARDAQRIYDFMVTSQAEMINLAGKDPLFVAEGSIAGHEEEYRLMNKKNFPYVYYKPYNEQGQQLPPPSRASREPPIQAMAALTQQSDYDMKAVIGIYGAGPGENGTPNESAFAVLTRQNQTETGTINWSDNLSRAIRCSGTILLDLWPKLIDEARVQRIINPDDSVKNAVVYNSEYSESEEAHALLDGDALKKVYDVGAGTYDVVLSTGPQYGTARKEAFKAIGAIIEAQPQLLPMLGDIWVKNADWPDAHILADRLKKLLPPNLQEQGDDPQSKLAQAQSQLQELGAQHQQLVAELARASDTIRTDRLNIESKERIATMQAQVQLVLQQMKDHAAGAQAQLEHTLGAISDRLEALHTSMSVEQEAGAAPGTPELPNKVQPKTLPVTPAAPTVPVPGTT